MLKASLRWSLAKLSFCFVSFSLKKKMISIHVNLEWKSVNFVIRFEEWHLLDSESVWLTRNISSFWSRFQRGLWHSVFSWPNITKDVRSSLAFILNITAKPLAFGFPTFHQLKHLLSTSCCFLFFWKRKSFRFPECRYQTILMRISCYVCA